MDFALTVSLPLENENLVDNMINNINKIIRDDTIDKRTLYSANVRSTKYLLLVLAFNLIDVEKDLLNKISNLAKLNDKFSVFNSAIEGKENTAFQDYDKQVIDELRKITLISKGSHTFDKVKEQMILLAYYIDNFNDKKTMSYQESRKNK